MDPATGMLIASLIGAGGNILGGIGAGKASDADRRAALQQTLAQLGINLDQFEEQLRQKQGEVGLANANATPNRVGWRQNQALAAAIMPGLRNTEVSSAIPGMSHFIPKVSGGLRIPEGGFGPDVMKWFSEDARLAGETDLDRAGSVASGGRAPIPDYAAAGYGKSGSAASSALQANASQLELDAIERERFRRTAMANALGQPAVVREDRKVPQPSGRNARPRSAFDRIPRASGGW